MFFPRERERNKKEKECETHRHFDASGRLPADFHVEEHDWVGHDDDFVRFKEKNAAISTTELVSPWPCQKGTKKCRQHTKKCKPPVLSVVLKKGGETRERDVIKKKKKKKHFMRP